MRHRARDSCPTTNKREAEQLGKRHAKATKAGRASIDRGGSSPKEGKEAKSEGAPWTEANIAMLCSKSTAFCALVSAALLVYGSTAQSCTSFYGYEIVRTFPHDHTAFTQGLEFERLCNNSSGSHRTSCRDILWESTGMYGKSTVRKVDLQTGEVLSQTALPQQDFGEGLVKDAKGRLVQLLWRTGKLYTYSPETLERIGTHDSGLRDGWGIATDGSRLYVTDSSTKLHTVSHETLKVTETKEITWKGTPVPWVNELEWIDGELWGNIWQTECIARINPRTAEVTSWVLMDGITQLTARSQTPRMDVLNGIAWDAMQRRLFLTGKYWPKLYQIALVKKPCHEANSLEDSIPRKCMRSGRF